MGPFLRRAEDGVLGSFGYAEFHDAFGRDLDSLAGFGVAAQTCGAVAQDELADAGQRESVLRVLVGEGGDVFEDFAGLLLGEFSLFGDCGGQLRFR